MTPALYSSILNLCPNMGLHRYHPLSTIAALLSFPDDVTVPEVVDRACACALRLYLPHADLLGEDLRALSPPLT